MQTVPKNKSTREHQFSICFWRSKIWKIKKSLKKHKKNKTNNIWRFFGEGTKEKSKTKKTYLETFWRRPQGENKKTQKKQKNLVGKPKRDAREIQREHLAPSVEVV